ncbi:unnamed protein product [Moneuplotes crassus]|uniref:Mitochondrial inner membrane protease subunit 2 n=1 Tax=Euplotes crassus TaxID=5936 RepID=A0AAD1XZ58_EUPCR|nr:unnamed protein product [Moneuplotes crassus]
MFNWFIFRNGKLSYFRLTAVTSLMAGLTLHANFIGLTRVKRNNENQGILDKITSIFKDEVILYEKSGIPTKMSRWNNCYVAVHDPFEPKNVFVSKVIATPGKWIQRRDDGGLIKLPTAHVWIENDLNKFGTKDSLSTYGPISSQHILGKAKFIIWPPWKFVNIQSLTKFDVFKKRQQVHSKVFTDREIRHLYGVGNYSL